MPKLGPQHAHIFRITHVRNLPWILKHGLHCRHSSVIDPNFVPIGLPELIEKRSHRVVPVPPGGTLADYVPFYFTPWSIMMLNIKSGRNGVIKRANEEIAVLVSSLHHLKATGVPFLFTDAHAYMAESDPFSDLADLDKIAWDQLNRRDFARDDNDPGKLGRYQAEALVHRHLPVEGLIGIACYNEHVAVGVRGEVARHGLATPVKALSGWYF